jgi:hypothetical protein
MKSRRKESPANAGLSFQEEPSNATFTIDDHETSAADCARDVMAITRMRFLPSVCLPRVDERPIVKIALGRTSQTPSQGPPEGFRNPAQSAPEPMPWAGFSFGGPLQ